MPSATTIIHAFRRGGEPCGPSDRRHANYHQLVLLASCDYTLIAEEIFAAGTYLSKEPSEVGGLTAQEMGKALAVLVMVVGSVFATLGNNVFVNLLKK